MQNHFSPAVQRPTIVKYLQPTYNGIQSHNNSRHGIGYVLRGKKYIYNGDVRQEVNSGDLFYLSSGYHYIEDIPDENKPFEQIVFYYSSDVLSRILAHLNVDLGFDIASDHKCPNCYGLSHVIYPAWSSVNVFFGAVNQYIGDGVFAADETAEFIKMTELIYILSLKECCIKAKIFENADPHKDNFEQMVYANVFNAISIESLAGLCNRSLTSFKKEFRKHFGEPPHKWFIRQRLMHSRLLLISTGKSISEVGNECNFPNTSHFIKLFKKEYGVTPSNYRNGHTERDASAGRRRAAVLQA